MSRKATLFLTACLLIGACSDKKNASLPVPPALAPHDGNDKKTEAPVDPKNSTTTILEGKWETKCVDFEDYSLQEPDVSMISVVTVKGDSLLYEEEIYGGHGCEPAEFIAVEYSKSYNFTLKAITDSVMTHSVDALKEDNSIEFTWVLRMENGEFLSASKEFLTTRSTSYYTGRFKKISQ